jgi:hypothetical protein
MRISGYALKTHCLTHWQSQRSFINVDGANVISGHFFGVPALMLWLALMPASRLPGRNRSKRLPKAVGANFIEAMALICASKFKL